jgi:hypothetical protein
MVPCGIHVVMTRCAGRCGGHELRARHGLTGRGFDLVILGSGGARMSVVPAMVASGSVAS